MKFIRNVASFASKKINRILARNVQSLDVEQVYIYISSSFATISRERERGREERTIIGRESGNLIERQRRRDTVGINLADTLFSPSRESRDSRARARLNAT